jgi:hypothetical protein
MATTAQNELIDLERRYWQAMKDRDTDTCMRLCDEHCLLSGPRGVQDIDRQMIPRMMQTSSTTLQDFRMQDEVVRYLGDDVAVVAYKVHEDMLVSGQPASFDAAESSTWVKRNGSWVCAAHTEANLGDPFTRAT